MSLGDDYLRLLNVLWNQERVNMWNPTCYGTLAYVMDRSFQTPDYERMMEKWMQWIQKEDLNSFSWNVVNRVAQLSVNDPLVPEKEKTFHREICESFRDPYERGVFGTFGIVSLESAPSWSLGIYQSYIILKKHERRKCVIEYCKTHANMSDERAESTYLNLLAQEDILNELYFYITHNRFRTFYPIRQSGYTAQELTEKTYLTPLGAYNYLLYLRNDPQQALADLKKGLPRK